MSPLPQISVVCAGTASIDGVQVPIGSPLASAIGQTLQSATIRPRRIMFVP